MDWIGSFSLFSKKALFGGLLAVVTFAEAATSGLWGVNGELWDNTYPSNSISSRIADASHAGYQGGDVPIPFYPVSIVATNFGAIPNDGIDDSAALQAAIDACPTNGVAIFLPEGVYNVTNTVFINKPNIVLRGSGPAKTVIEALNGISAIKLDGDTTKQGLSMVNGFLRGDTEISNVALANQAQVGDLIYMQLSLSKYDGAAFSNLVEQCIGGVQIPQFSGNVSCKMYAKVVGVAGKVVSFDRPLEYSFQGGTKKWGLGIMRPVMHDAGVEDLTVTFDPDYPYAKHFNGTAPGPDYEEDVTTDGIYLQACVNCWVRNVEVREACSAISMYGENVQCTVSDVTLVAERMSQSEFPLQSGLDYDYAMQFDTPLESNYWDVRAHAAVALTGSHMLAERIRLNYAGLHDLTINSTVNSVFSDVKGFDISLDHHRQNGSRNLYTQIDVGLGRKFWLSSGLNSAGIQCGAWETFWNIDSALEQDFPSYAATGNAFCRGYINLVGIHALADPVTDASPRWFEADIGPGELDQPNLYEAMRVKRFSENGWDAFPPTAVASADTFQGTDSLTVNFTGDSSSDNIGIVSALWNFGDGCTSWETNAQHTYTESGVYTASLTVRDARNLRDTQEITITVLESDGLYDLNYRLAGSAELENHALGTGHALVGATNQVVAEGGAGIVVIAVPGSGCRFAGWSDGVRTAVRIDTNVLQSLELTAYFMEGTAPSGSGPTDLSLGSNTVEENAANGTLAGTFTATDPDAGETFVYQLTDDAGGRFAIDASSGELTVADADSIVYASNTTHSITVLVLDSTSEFYSESFTIQVLRAGAPPPVYAPLELLVNGSFESGSANFVFTGNAGNIALAPSMAGQWAVRESGEDTNMDLADASGVVSGQDGNVSMMFQIASKRGIVQVVDVSDIVVSGLQINFSAVFAAPGREGMTSSDMACYQVVGFNDFTGLTVDLGGTYAFTSGTYDNLVAKRTIADAELSGNAYTIFSNSVTPAVDYNYLAVLAGGLASANNNNSEFVGVDAVQLILMQIAEDSDGDGLTDAQEIALGTDPGDPESVFGFSGSAPLPMSGKIELFWPSATGVLYRVWQSPDMAGWTVIRDWAIGLTPPEDAFEFDLTPSNSYFKIEADIQ
ncbi:PKD domain-containing protein [Pontiella sulfatireligans]|uniref:Protease 1 n=1 Tax=Pontiella sulfatireligans TaxID=2750658 RepID=A0A6C2UEN2_9BACT|nr:PKD domain-containing protein [Pontiella sulfatireligans]VGO18672.1 Protease 1 [Pontiella sulfatireligans]